MLYGGGRSSDSGDIMATSIAIPPIKTICVTAVGKEWRGKPATTSMAGGAYLLSIAVQQRRYCSSVTSFPLWTLWTSSTTVVVRRVSLDPVPVPSVRSPPAVHMFFAPPRPILPSALSPLCVCARPSSFSSPLFGVLGILRRRPLVGTVSGDLTGSRSAPILPLIAR